MLNHGDLTGTSNPVTLILPKGHATCEAQSSHVTHKVTGNNFGAVGKAEGQHLMLKILSVAHKVNDVVDLSQNEYRHSISLHLTKHDQHQDVW